MKNAAVLQKQLTAGEDLRYIPPNTNTIYLLEKLKKLMS